MKTTCKRCGCEIWGEVAIEHGYCHPCWSAGQIARDFARIARVERERLREAIGKDVCGQYLTSPVETT